MRRILVLVTGLVAVLGVAAGATPAAAQTAPEPQADVLVLGDSLCVGAAGVGGLRDLLVSADLTADLRCTVGVPLATGLAVARSMPTVPPVVIVELGTNPSRSTSAFRADALALVQELRARGAIAIRWLTAGTTTPSRYDEQNAVVRSLTGITVADWAAVLAADPSIFLEDGVHYTRAGNARFAAYLLDQMISASGEATADGMRQQVRRLYLATFLREPDEGGLWYWTVARWYQVPLATIAQHFVASPEFQARYGQATPEVLVDLVYRNILRRAPDPTGAAYWIGRLQAGMRAGELLVGFSESAEFRLANLPGGSS
jgi:hypothetical protein